MEGFLNNQLSKRTSLFGLRLWVVIGIGVGAFIVLVLFFISVWLASRRRSNTAYTKFQSQNIPIVSKEIKEVPQADGVVLTITDKCGDGESEKVVLQLGIGRKGETYGGSGESGNGHVEKNWTSQIATSRSGDGSVWSGESGSTEMVQVTCIPEVSHLGWGRWYTLRDLEVATDGFAEACKIGEGGYGVVYRGIFSDGSVVAIKRLLNNLGQAEREFTVEVEAIGKVRHKNLVRLLGYCAEGSHRMLVYEYVDNGNLEHWLHGMLPNAGDFAWEARIKVALGTAKALAYLHEALEPKVVHRDIKASNILVDRQWNAKISDFGLAKLLGSEKSHVTTRVMGTFGYVAPEYANTGLLNERSDVYSFGVLMMEMITGRDPVDYSRPPGEVNLVEWLKHMVATRRSDEVLDPRILTKPSSRGLKKALLVAIRCVDPDSTRRPKMGHVVHMLEADDFPYRDDRRSTRTRSSGAQPEKSPESTPSSKRDDRDNSDGAGEDQKRWKYEG